MVVFTIPMQPRHRHIATFSGLPTKAWAPAGMFKSESRLAVTSRSVLLPHKEPKAITIGCTLAESAKQDCDVQKPNGR